MLIFMVAPNYLRFNSWFIQVFPLAIAVLLIFILVLNEVIILADFIIFLNLFIFSLSTLKAVICSLLTFMDFLILNF